MSFKIFIFEKNTKNLKNPWTFYFFLSQHISRWYGDIVSKKSASATPTPPTSRVKEPRIY